MLGLRLGRLKRTGEDGNLHIPQLLRHLRMREVLVDNDPLHQHAVLHASSHLRPRLEKTRFKKKQPSGFLGFFVFFLFFFGFFKYLPRRESF